MLNKSIEEQVVAQVITKFRDFPVDILATIFNMSESDVEKTKKFVLDFAALTEGLPSNNLVLYDVKSIFLATMICMLKGPLSVFELANSVSTYMKPSGADLELIQKVLKKVNEAGSAKDIQSIIMDEIKAKSNKENNIPEGVDEAELTNILDDDGNRMTISQVEKMCEEKESKNNGNT